MSAVPAARYLADFGADAGADMPLALGGEAAQAVAAAELDEAFARGQEAGQAAARAEFDAALEAQRTAAQEQLAAEREAWAGETGQKLASGLLAGLQELEARIADTAARVLKPFVAARLHARAVAELQAGLDTLVMADAGAGFRISGPADVLEALRGHLADKPVAVAYSAGEACDVRVVAGHATLETCLKDWLAKLDETVP